MAVFSDSADELVFGYDSFKVPPESGKHGIPDAGTESGESDKLANAHFGQASRDRDELTNSGYEATNEGGYHAMLVEELFGGFALKGFLNLG